jgi:hypothetical protein
MSDLQHKLDGQPQPQFDKEALWGKIERPTRRRRRWLWFFLPALLLVISLAGAYHFGVFDFNTTTEAKTATQDNAIHSPAATTPNKGTIQQGNSIPQLSKSHTKTSTAETASAEISSTHPYKASLQKQRSITDVPSGNEPETANILPNTAPPGYLTPDTSYLLPDTRYLTPNILHLIPKIPILSFQPLKTPKTIEFDPRIKPSISRNHFLRNEIQASSGLAYQLHQFNGEDCNFRTVEQADPGYFVNLTYKRKLKEDIYLLASMQYSVHHSNVEASSTYSQQFLGALNTITVYETTTYYKLYNEYHRLDFGIGAGYAWQKKSYTYGVEAQLGAAKWLKVEGDYLDNNADLQLMKGADALPPTLFGRLNGFVSKTFSNQVALGVNIALQSPMRVSGAEEGCEHQLWPIYLGGSVRRAF